MSLPVSLVVDANAILSALIGGQSKRLFKSTGGVELHTTAWTIAEVTKYIPKFAAKTGADEETFHRGLQAFPLQIHELDEYQDEMAEAAQRIGDPKDVELLALARKLGLPVWSNDKHFTADQAGVPVYRTAELLALLDAGPTSDSLS